MTAPASRRSRRRRDEFGEWWHYTGRSLGRLGEEPFGVGNVEARAYGNVLERGGIPLRARGVGSRPEELAARDRLFEVIVGVRAVNDRASRGRGHAARLARASGTPVGESLLHRRRAGSSSSSRRCSRITSASPRTAASTAYSASSTSVGTGKQAPGPPRRQIPVAGRIAKLRSASRRRVSMTRLPSATPCSSSSSSPRASRSTRRSGRPKRPEHVCEVARSAARDVLLECLALQLALRAHWASERRGKWKPRSGTSPEAARAGCRSAAWLPRVTWISGWPRCRILRIGLYSEPGR